MKSPTYSLNPASSKAALDQVLVYRKYFRKMMDELLEYVCEWIINRANDYIEMSGIGSLVKLDIRNAWSYAVINGNAVIENNADKAVFVEFGVGIVGENNPHPQSAEQSYQYNVPSESKLYDGSWYFWTNSNELDLPLSAVFDRRGFDDFRGRKREKGKRMVVGTQGAKGTMYAYNAIVDAQVELQKKNGDFAIAWQKIKERYAVV